MPAALRLVAPDSLPHVWRAPELARAVEAVVPSGHAALDAELPGGGWPVGSLIELLQAQAGAHAWQLLLPALASLAQREDGPVALVDAPFVPFGPALAAQGLPVERLLRVKAPRPQAALWAAEQALRCADVVAVLAWLPRVKATELRRLHLAAAQHDKFLVAFRGLEALREASPARLRLQVEGTRHLQVRIAKRRGPPLVEPIELRAHPARLAALLEARKRQGPALPNLLPKDRSHVLDRTVALA